MRSTPRAAAALDLRFDDAVIRACVEDDDGDLAWVAQALACGFEPSVGPAPHATVRLRVDADAYAALHARGAPAGAEINGFAQDAEPYPLQPWRGDEAARLLHDERIPAFYRLDVAARTVDIAAGARGRKSRMALLRVVRELAMDRIVAGGGVLVHGAALASDAGVVVITAPKRHGKTTLLLSLLAHGGLSYVSNDRCVLRLDAAGARVRGLPTIVSITRDGLARFPAVRERLYATRPDLAGDSPGVGLTPDEFVRMLGLPCTPAGAVAAFVFPHISAQPRRLAFERLAPEVALEHLRTGLFRAGHAALLGEAFAWDTPRGLSPRDAGDAVLRRVAAHVPCFAAALGGDRPPEGDECGALLDAITAAQAG